MTFKQLFLFVEGDRDERFHRKVLVPLLANKYNVIKVIQWRQKPKKSVKKIIQSLKFADYILFADIDSSLCVTQKKESLYEFVEKDKTIIVIMEIESWFLAGLDAEASKKLKMKFLENTDDVTKEMFRDLIKQRFDSDIDAMIEILKYFAIEIAKSKNKSFKYFIEKYC